MMNLANAITTSRLLFGLVMIFMVLLENKTLFFLFYLIALLTDVLDGSVARYLKQTSEFGKIFDALADNFIVVCIFIGLFILFPEKLLRYIYFFLVIFAYYVVVQIISYTATGKLIFLRTTASLVSAVIFPVTVFSLLFGVEIFVYLYVLSMFYTLTEKLFLQLKIKSKVAMFMIFIVLSSLVIFLIQPNQHACFENGTCIRLEIRDTSLERSQGLMYRQTLGKNQGMLFVFEEPGTYAFWMKNMNFNIDIIFLDEEFKIISIEENVPPCSSEPCILYAPKSPSKYVIETNEGFASQNNLKENQLVSLDI